MVWITGGMFEIGSGAWYDGSRFARDGVVYVSINYRVGADGFLYLGDGNTNTGLLDQVAALEWVRENIAAFGGDPGNVTVFGESAGAMSIGILLSMPRARGLFRRAIAESGAAHTVMSAATAGRIGRILAERLGVEPTREALAAVPMDRFLAAQGELKTDVVAHPDPARWGVEVVTTLLPFHPVLDGEVIPAPPIERIAAGAGADVDVLVGTNTDDWRLLLAMSGLIERTTDEALAGMVALYGLPVEATVAAYRAAYPGASAGDLLGAFETDWYVRIPAIRLADAHTKSTAWTYMYEFAWQPPEFGGRFGAGHSMEIPFVFDHLDKNVPFIGTFIGPLLGPNPPQQLADTMHAAWVAFATKGNPGWPRYDLRRRATMRFDMTSRVVDDPRAAERAVWEGFR
jgi:carboxylesterase type B